MSNNMMQYEEVIMNQKDIERINELYKKQKEGTLTPEEALEQSKLRHAYIAAIRKNLRGSLESIQIQEQDGSITDVPAYGTLS